VARERHPSIEAGPELATKSRRIRAARVSERLVFPFRPRYVALPWLSIAAGAALGGAVLLFDLGGAARTFAVTCAVVGPLLGALYLLSPAWRLRVEVDEEALAVYRGADLRFRLPWAEVVRVLADPAAESCVVDGGDPSRTLIVPGPATRTPYRIAGARALVDYVLAHVDKSRITT
jgi:hypothetical protein